MSSAKKHIVIAQGSLSPGANNTTMKRQRKVKPSAMVIRPTMLKQKLLQELHKHKQRNEETPGNNSNSNSNGNNSNSNSNSNRNPLSNEDLSNQFKMSTDYLQQLINKKKASKHNKKSVSQPPQIQMQPPQMQTQPPQMQMQTQPPQMQMQPPQMQEVSLELPPELQLNPIAMSHVPMPIQQPMPTIIQSDQTQNTITPTAIPNPIVLKDVPYGCLRGGNKPTYRTYHRGQNVQSKPPIDSSHNTTVKKPLFSGIHVSPEENADPMIHERQRKLREIQETFHTQTQSSAQAAQAADPQKMKNVIKQTTTKKYKLGKAPGSNVVGVLIKNNDTRRKIQEEHGVLRRESIVEIRKYLHDHGLIKVGSDAPPDVLRNIYESAKMTGEISNTNKHVMLHNFLKSDDNDTLHSN